MTATVRRLLARPNLGLRVLAGQDALDRPVSWVAVSELPDPTPYLEGGELVLLTGLGFEPQDADAYVARLVARGVSGIGFGVGVRHAQVPPTLVAASRAAGLVLLEVDPPTPFVAVSRAVADLVDASRSDQVRRRLDGMRALTADVARAGDPQAAVRRLAAQLGGWVVLLDARLRVRFTGRASAAVTPRPDLAVALAERVRGSAARGGSGSRPLASAAVTDGPLRLVVVPLGVGRATGYLAVGVPTDPAVPAPQEPDHQLVAFAAALLTLDQERSRGARPTVRWAQAAAFAWAAGLPLPEPAAEGAADVLGPLGQGAPVRVVAVGAAGAPAVRAALDDDERALALQVDDALLVVVAQGDVDAVLDGLVEAVREVPGGPRLVVSRAWPAHEVAAAVDQARDLLRRCPAGAAGGVLRAEDAPATLTALLDDALGAAAVAGFAEQVLAPLAALDPAERDQLEATLATWLQVNGETGAAATALAVHRHTVRQRLRRAATVLQRDLDDPRARVDLWVALGARGRV